MSPLSIFILIISLVIYLTDPYFSKKVLENSNAEKIEKPIETQDESEFG